MPDASERLPQAPDAQLAAAAKPPAYITHSDAPSDNEPDAPILVAEPRPPRVKRVSIKSINIGGTWQVKSKEDIDARLEELRQRLYGEFEDGAVLNVEF